MWVLQGATRVLHECCMGVAIRGRAVGRAEVQSATSLSNQLFVVRNHDLSSDLKGWLAKCCTTADCGRSRKWTSQQVVPDDLVSTAAP